jgi:glyoxylase-like metal-dependent hydrolase (beta-lactamase superfamily II)
MTKSKQYHDWDTIFQNPGDITVESLNTGYITGVREGMINTRSEMYQGQCPFKNAKLPVLAHLINRNGKYHLVDTGFDSSFSQRWGGSFKGFLRPLYFRNRYFQTNTMLGIEKQLEIKKITPDIIFLTHAHEHCVGLGALDDAIPLVMGKGEHDVNVFPFVYSTQIKARKNVRELNFDTDGTEMPLFGRCIDLFGDGSFWAIDTHGHTKGHLSYLVNGHDRIVLLTGDASVTSLGFSIGVETGAYSENAADTKVSFDRIRKFADFYPQVDLIFGHEVVGHFEIEYGE